MGAIRIVQYGLGPIGVGIAKLVLEKQGLELVGGVDIAEDKVGKDLSEVLGLSKRLGKKVHKNLASLLKENAADVVLQATGSRVKSVVSQLKDIIELGLNVVSTCEELAYPQWSNARLADELDQLAKKKGVTVLSTGVNPGFVMDAMTIALTGVCVKVDKVEVTRIVDASTRRESLQRKVGAGMESEAFKTKVTKGELGHVGLIESVAMVAESLGWKLSSIEQTIEPVISPREVKTKYLRVARGKVAGIHQVAVGSKDGQEKVRMTLKMYVGADDPQDEVKLQGFPDISMKIPGGTPGDIATAAIIVNSIPRVVHGPPGLVTVKDLPMASTIMGDASKLLLPHLKAKA